MNTGTAIRRIRTLALALAAAASLTLLSGCSPLSVLAYLNGCKGTGTASATAPAASAAKGDWTRLVGMDQAQVSAIWPESTGFCATYRPGFQCTWWACMRERSLGHTITQYMGNGADWAASAAKLGWQQGAAIGGIISYAPGAGGADPVYGHVAVIEQIDGDTLHLTEGGTGVGRVHAAMLSATHPPTGITYWHPAGDKTAPAGTTPPKPSTSTGTGSKITWECAARQGATSGTADVSYTGSGVHATPSQAQGLAKQMIASGYKSWDNDNDWQALVWIWNHESGWRWDAENPSSGAYGIPQSLPGFKMASAGPDWHDNAATQIRWGLEYIKGRYGSPSQAKAFWQSHNWY